MLIVVAMSGGIDSLRTAVLLREKGYDVLGVHMRLLPSSRNGRWHAESTIRSREEALGTLASKVGIPLTIVDARETFESLVIQPFLEAYRQGLTPNPCIRCNPQVKFGILLDEARRLGADRIATGHYAGIRPPDGDSDRFRLYKAKDRRKDQSYFLSALSQEQLAAVLFPLGDQLKREVVRWGHDAGFGPLVPEESQEICFIPSGNYLGFIQERLGSASPGAGAIVDTDGDFLARHKGIFAYTIGQRKGLGIASNAPYYVVEIIPSTNTVVVGRTDDLLRNECTVADVNWVSVSPPNAAIRAEVRIRNQHIPAPASIEPLQENRILIRFDTPQRAVTPGQAAVFYAGDMLLGGGTIEVYPTRIRKSH